MNLKYIILIENIAVKETLFFCLRAWFWLNKSKKMLYDEFRALEINAVFLILIFFNGPFNAGPFNAGPYLTPLQNNAALGPAE